MKKILGILISVFGILLCGQNVSALTETWGPQDRETYTWAVPASRPVFNSITDNPDLGDERNFVRVREYKGEDYDEDVEGENDFIDYVDAEAGKEYEVYVYYHNNASSSLNESGTGIAQNVRLKIEAPVHVSAGKTAVIKGTISWGTEGAMEEVWDTAFLTASEKITLSYNSTAGAVIHNSGTANGSVLDGSALFGDGALLAYSKKYWGIIPGCNDFAGYVTFRIKATGEEEVVEPETEVTEPEVEVTEPEVEVTEPEAEKPTEIVDTGPAEITLAVIIVLTVGILAYYMIRTRMVLRKIEDENLGKTGKNRGSQKS